ncbi:low-density lipoprotein receptor-related protein 1B-like isoform X2 [Gigantopelta aegis]|uniref:low-density lipoprotein receptor-related protein 1B-like isoform X2 n=1 Tax=Gigantopelta aegis TaxID=1735272 RepID=UPI001B8890E5|nr:low-density lipoprotein receptor-related protein 1B-like isoform X2 [Gigantopelta aegis]
MYYSLFKNSKCCFILFKIALKMQSPAVKKKYGKHSSWIMLFTEVIHQKIHVYNVSDGTWVKTLDAQERMISLNIDIATWRAYWIDDKKHRLVSSDLKGNDKKILASGIFTYQVALDTKNRRLFYCDMSIGKPHIGFADIDSGVTTIVEQGGENPSYKEIEVSPDLRLIYWKDRKQLMQRHYDGNETKIIEGYCDECFGLTIDRIYTA